MKTKIKVRYQATTRVPGEKVGIPTESFDDAANLTMQHGGTVVIKYTGNYLPDATKEEISL